MDLRGLWWAGSRVTVRYVLMLVGQLPEGSAFFASMQGGQKYRSWTLQNHLLGFIGNSLYAANRQRGGQATKTLPITPPKPRSRPKPRRVVRIAGLPSTRKVAGSG